MAEPAETTAAVHKTPAPNYAFKYFRHNKYKMPVKSSTLKKRASAHRPQTRSMSAATKSKRQAAAAKARAGRGKKLNTVKENNNGSRKSKNNNGSRKSKGGFFSW